MKKFTFFTLLLVSCFMQAQVITPELADSLQKILDESLDTYHVKGASASLLTDEDQWTGVSGVSYDKVSIYPEFHFWNRKQYKKFCCDSFPSGIYLIQVLMDMKTYSRKIIKK